MSKVKGYRTIIFNTAVLVFSLIEAQLGTLREVYGPTVYLFASILVPLVNMWLRMTTTTPMGQKES